MSTTERYHEGRPTIRGLKDGTTLALCPFGHVLYGQEPGAWGGSWMEARATDRSDLARQVLRAAARGGRRKVTLGASIPYTVGMETSRHPNTDHDEAYNRAHWHEGESWLGIESMRNPKRKAARRITSGTILSNERTTTATGKGSR